MILLWIDIFGFIILLVGSILLVTGKLKMDKSFYIVTFLLLLPFIVSIIFTNFHYSLVKDVMKEKPDFSQIILMLVFALEFIIASVFIIIKYNVFPFSCLSKQEAISKDIISIDKARKLLNFAIYSYIVNLPFSILLILYPTFVITVFNMVLMSLPGVAVFLLPIEIYIYMVITSIITIIFIVTYIFTINGTIRFLSKSNFNKGDLVLYSILMVIPFANFASSIILSQKAKKILQKEGFKVSVFGAKCKIERVV